MIKVVSRKQFLKQSISTLGLGVAGALWLVSCGGDSESETTEEVSKDPCNDFSKVAETDLKAREKMGYVKASPVAGSNCSNCQLYLPFKETPSCGNCQLFKGPVEAAGHCTYWAPQVNMA
jgi:hypothetical protein